MTKNQLQSFAIKLRLISNELRNLEEVVVDTLYQSDAQYYGTLLDEDIDLVKYKTASVKEKLAFLDDFLSQEFVDNLEVQQIISEIKAEVGEEQQKFASGFKEE